MAGGGYRGGSTILYSGNLKAGGGIFSGRKIKKSRAMTPGLHVLSKKEQYLIKKKVAASRRRSEAILKQKKTAAEKVRSSAFSKFASDFKKQQID